MFIYRIKVTSDRLLRTDAKYNMMDLKLFKHKDLINKSRSAKENKFRPNKKNLTEKPVRGDKDYKSFILNRYNAHLLIEYLYADKNGEPIVNNGYNGKNKSKKNIGNHYSYAISFKPAIQNKNFSSCSNQDAYLILKTEKPLDKDKIYEINSEYKRITNRKNLNPKHNEPQLIKQMSNRHNKFDSGKLVFKKNSPVVLKSTIKQIDDPSYSNEFYQDIYIRNNVQSKVKNLYSYLHADEEKRGSKSVYFIPEGTEGYIKNDTTPIVELTREDYLKMAIHTLNLKITSEELVKPRLSIIKANKPKDGYENIFNVFGVAFELKNPSEEVFKRANVNGLGHYTGFGFGFAYTLDQTTKEVHMTMRQNQQVSSKTKNNWKNQNSHGGKKKL